MNRQIYNNKIVKKLKEDYPKFYNKDMEEFVRYLPQQRFGQIVCNYIYPDYRSNEVSDETIEFMEFLFPNNGDPFYEEPDVTYKRLISYGV